MSKFPTLEKANTPLKVSKAEYERDLKVLQDRLMLLQTAYITRGLRAVIAMEGWDAAGKGGTIRRMTMCLDPRFFRVHPIAAPDEHERKRHYLYRFWTRLPGDGEIAIFDRTWYGRVLVERVEGYCSTAEWQRSYREINDFEAMLTDAGSRVIKLFLHTSQDAQAEQFIERLQVPYKRWKTGADDYRNRARWDDYWIAINDMLEKTHTRAAPWSVIPMMSRKGGRLAALRQIIAQLEQGVDLSPPALDRDLHALAEKSLGRTIPV